MKLTDCAGVSTQPIVKRVTAADKKRKCVLISLLFFSKQCNYSMNAEKSYYHSVYVAISG